MSRKTLSSHALFVAATVAAACPSVSRAGTRPRMMMHPDTDMALIITQHTQVLDQYQPITSTVSKQQLVGLRMQGVDIDRIQSRELSSELSISPVGYYPTTFLSITSAHMLNTEDGQLSPRRNMLFSIGRSTTLSDGNIAGSLTALPGDGNSVATMTQSEGEYNFYEMALEWKAASAGPVDFTFISGITAIEANVSKSVRSGTSTEIHDATHRVVMVPTVGSSVRWNISRGWSLTGQATTQSLNMGSSLMGFNAQTDWRISDQIEFVAGYQIIRSEFDLGAITTDLNQEGLFARLSIQF